jgi:hypothetical protein
MNVQATTAIKVAGFWFDVCANATSLVEVPFNLNHRNNTKQANAANNNINININKNSVQRARNIGGKLFVVIDEDLAKHLGVIVPIPPSLT